MSTKTCLSITLVLVLAATLTAVPAMAGLYHTGNTLICSDCHTMHFSMQHGWAGGSVSSGTGKLGGDWLGASGPNPKLLKAPSVNALCESCHDGQTFAPDVVGINANASSQTQGREAGALNTPTLGTPYETWKGHTLGSNEEPPGYDPTLIGMSATWYDWTSPEGLSCSNCHSVHGGTMYRNLGPHGTPTAIQPSYVVSTTNDLTKDVWVNIPSTYAAGSGVAATFAPYYDMANVNFNRIDATVGSIHTSNKISTFCAACHGDFHGGLGDTQIGPASADGDFIRHPTADAVIGSGMITNLARFVSNTTKVHVLTTDYTGYTDAVPTCISCHKGHGNQNPFGLIFLNRNATAVNEEGGFGTGQPTDTGTALRNLCGQCHSNGN